MRKILFFVVCCVLFASEDHLVDKYPQKHLQLSEEQKKILKESSVWQDLNKQEKKRQDISQKKSIKGSVQSRSGNQVKSTTGSDINQNVYGHSYPYRNFQASSTANQQKKNNVSFDKRWIYGTAVITTTFLNGSIKRSYGILLRDGMFVTSANMVYDQNVYARESYAMMQDDSSLPFICIARLSIKALDLQKGLAILETLNYTDIYCNKRSKSHYHDRIYSGYWVDVFKHVDPSGYPIVYSPYITQLDSFATERNILQENLEQLAQKESNDFEGYKYAYGKGFYTHDGKLLGMIGASNDNVPKFIKTQEISSFLCELKVRKILKNPYLSDVCPTPPKKEE